MFRMVGLHSPTQLERIFDRYCESCGANGGSGLGLTIAKAGIESHGGRIDARSQVGRGTRFRVTLPVCPFSSSLSEPPARLPAMSRA